MILGHLSQTHAPSSEQAVVMYCKPRTVDTLFEPSVVDASSLEPGVDAPSSQTWPEVTKGLNSTSESFGVQVLDK